ncbi:GTP-binding protein GEM-like [Limulus polyphemus]|uniref:GTP-binding protein GEM-like n=1 Tax=Limulus polyphemus TaxID=6850 RepID=A0ABM1B6M8_LIMPO|nr:GTP-binding protein GEM-like [Limulus polyphemus]
MTSQIPQSAPDLRRLSCHEALNRNKRGWSLTPAMDKFTCVQNISSGTIIRRNSQQRPLGDHSFFQSKESKQKKTGRSYSVHNSSHLQMELSEKFLFRQRFASFPLDANSIFNPRLSRFPENYGGFYQTLRNFSSTPKGVVNQGDSFRSRKNSLSTKDSHPQSLPAFINQSSIRNGDVPRRIFRVAVSGSSEVGKSLLTRQFTTSELICTFDSVMDDGRDTSVNVVLNQDESTMIFSECTLSADKCSSESSNTDAHIVVYSVADRTSFHSAKCFLERLSEGVNQPIILVGNKTDLVRHRVITTHEGRSLARKHGCKFIETAACINYQVDELLVGILSQIRLKNLCGHPTKKYRTFISLGIFESKVENSLIQKNKTFFGRFLEKLFGKSRSCENLHVL